MFSVTLRAVIQCDHETATRGCVESEAFQADAESCNIHDFSKEAIAHFESKGWQTPGFGSPCRCPAHKESPPKVKVRAYMMGGWVCLIPEADGFRIEKRVESFDIPSTPKALAKFVGKIAKWCDENSYECTNIKDGKMSIG